MIELNEGLKNLTHTYLFGKVAERVEEYEKTHPTAKVIRMGIGDVTLPIPKSCVKAMKKASAELGRKKTFRGYGPYGGYSFLKEKIVNEYEEFGVKTEQDEVFVSDGAKSDLAAVLELFSKDDSVLITDPDYPAYEDANVVDGRKIFKIRATYENGFLPLPDENTAGDIIYLCSPANPTGAVYDEQGLKKWVEFAKETGGVIFFDRAYYSYITGKYPKTIYEIDGAKEVAIEFSSFSKNAGFTGVRCGYVTIPKELKRDGFSLNELYKKRQSVKSNGTSYIVQRGAEATFSKKGKKEVANNVAYYLRNAELITETLKELNVWYVGGENSPYIFMKCPYPLTSWEFFDKLLYEANIVTTPGVGFGESGEGFLRLTAFSSYEDTKIAVDRLKALIQRSKI